MSSTWYPPPSRPRPVEGGIKARSTRGAIAQTWWSERFIAVLEDIGLGNRLQRGRSYARKGQVISLQVDAGLVTALVQGSRARPYRIRIGIPAFGKSQWAHVERTLAENAWYAAKLLSGEMPEDIEDVFAGLGLSLFPGTARELSLDCSCPDYAVPCKHLAATFYLLAESFDEDPFAILARRGLQGLAQWAGHVVRDHAGHQQRIGVSGRGDQPRPEPLRVIHRAKGARNLHLTPVARTRVNMSDLQRTPYPGGWFGYRRR